MAKRTPAQVFADLLGAGFTRDQATTLDAIAGGESGWNDTELGDVGLENSEWGPSVGLFQIRTLKSQTGTGTDRDIQWLMASDANQAKAAYDISHHGTDFSPWTVYTSGKWQSFLGQAQSAAHSTPSTAAALLAGGTGSSSTGGFGDVLGGLRGIAIEGLAVVLGLGLVAAGLAQALAPKAKAGLAGAVKVGKVAAVL